MTAQLETKDFGTIPVLHRDCPLCARNNNDVAPSRYSEEPWKIKQCAGCGFVYIDSRPHYEAQAETMAWERTRAVEQERRADIRPISFKASKNTRFRLHLLPRQAVPKHLARHPTGGNLLDLGCGAGRRHARDLPANFTPFGIEISAELAAIADRAFRERGGYVINAPCMEGLARFEDGFFAAAALRGYLEHEAEPLPALAGLHRVLAPGGIAVVKVPNYASLNRRLMGKRWCGFRYPDHLNYFTPQTLSAMAAKAGFATRFGITGRLPTSDNIWAVLTKS